METKVDCPCKKMDCKFHGNCAACIAKHNKAEQLPHCIFPDNDGDRSVKNYYIKLKDKFTS